MLIDHLGLGGAELLLGHFARVAPSQDIRLSVACLKRADDDLAERRLRDAGVEPVVLDAPERIGVQALRTVYRHVASLNPDLLHTHLGISDTLGSLAARALGVPAVSSIHAMAWTGGNARSRARVRLMAFARRRGVRVIAVSESARTDTDGTDGTLRIGSQ